MKFLLDENISPKTYKFLKNLGHDMADVRLLNVKGIKDRQLIEIAAKQTRILITFDLDFSDLRDPMAKKLPGLIILRTKRFSSQFINVLLENFIVKHKPKDIAGKICIITESQVRFRSLST